MLHIHIDDIHPRDVDIYVNISSKSFTNSTPKKEVLSPILPNNYSTPRRDSIGEYPRERVNYSQTKKIYTLEQILDNVDTIQKHYEQITENPLVPPPSCFVPLKQLSKIFKNFRLPRSKPVEQQRHVQQMETKSPFIFGGETLRWIALPQYHDHIYENELIR